MTQTINISLNVPETYKVEELTRQLTEYGKRLIAMRKATTKQHKRPSENFLKGFTLPQQTSPEQLVDDYIAEKYGL